MLRFRSTRMGNRHDNNNTNSVLGDFLTMSAILVAVLVAVSLFNVNDDYHYHYSPVVLNSLIRLLRVPVVVSFPSTSSSFLRHQTRFVCHTSTTRNNASNHNLFVKIMKQQQQRREKKIVSRHQQSHQQHEEQQQQQQQQQQLPERHRQRKRTMGVKSVTASIIRRLGSLWKKRRRKSKEKKHQPPPKEKEEENNKEKAEYSNDKNEGGEEDQRRNIFFLFPTSMNQSLIHSFFMNITLEEANRAEHIYNEVPIAASVIRPIGLVSVPPAADNHYLWNTTTNNNIGIIAQPAPLVSEGIKIPKSMTIPTKPLSPQQQNQLSSLSLSSRKSTTTTKFNTKTKPATKRLNTPPTQQPIITLTDHYNNTKEITTNDSSHNNKNSNNNNNMVVVQIYDYHGYELLSIASNRVETYQDASAHAEMLALRKAARVVNNWRLYGSVLYSTLEPCPMCLSACYAFRIHQIVYGAPDIRLGAIRSYIHMMDDHDHPMHTISDVVSGVEEETSSRQMIGFFRSAREKKRKEKQKQKQKQKEEQKT